MHSARKYFILLATLLMATGCTHKKNSVIQRAFYYWRSGFSLKHADKAYLDALGISKIYLHFFDVEWNEGRNRALPADEINFETPAPSRYSYVPVVYIQNKALEQTPADSMAALGKYIMAEVQHIAFTHNLPFTELQCDCDWTGTTREKYFSLLSQLHTQLKSSGRLLSATIRLHQVKYSAITGIPPADRGMLMFYNMGKINTLPGYNSIYTQLDADKYTAYIHDYALPLDLALPIFSWAVCIRQGRPVALFEKAGVRSFADTSLFSAAGNDIFVSRNSFFLHGRYFMKNDTVKLEQVTPELCRDAAANASRYLKDEKRTVSLFEYDTTYTSTYEKTDFEKIFSAAR